MPCFEPVGVSDDHQIAEAARVVLGVAYPSVERGTDRLAHFQRDIHPVVVATAARTVLRQYVSDDGRSELAQILDDFQVDYGRQVGILDALVREDLRGVPVLGIDRQRVERTQGRSVEAPCVVAVQDHFRLRVVCRQRVERPLGQFFEMGSGRRSRRFASLGVDAGQAKKKTDRQYKVFEHSVGFRTKAKVRNIFYFRPRRSVRQGCRVGTNALSVLHRSARHAVVVARFGTKRPECECPGRSRRVGSCRTRATVGRSGCRRVAWPACGGFDSK